MTRQSKINAVKRYAAQRAVEIKAAVSSGQITRVAELISRYSGLSGKQIGLLAESQTSEVKSAVADQIDQQKTLSDARQNTADETVREEIAAAQQAAANQMRSLIKEKESDTEASQFADSIVSSWRDPDSTVSNEQATRVYAVGTQASSNTNDGVIIDSGEGRVTQTATGDLKIEYAPGTGPNSMTTAEGKKIWKIQLSDGTIIESYTAASRVVIGQAGGTAGNIVVTSSGGTSSTAQVVSGGGGQAASQVVIGGKASVVGQEAGGAASDPSQITQKVLNSTNQTNQINDTSGTSGGNYVAPAQPIEQKQ